MKSLVFSIQKYSIHDGDGIRTTVFFKGCPMTCKWCHNPESQSYRPSILQNTEKCTGCKKCTVVCQEGAITYEDSRVKTSEEKCNLCEKCIDGCINNAREIVGKYYSLDDIMKEIEKDKLFYEQSGGGITLSGGEIMTQDMDYIIKILKKCHRLGYKVNIDTCGHAKFENFEKILPYIDTFLYDIKHMDSDVHKELTGVGNELVLGNLRKLSENSAKINIRIPLVEGINSAEEHIDKIIAFLKELKIYKINLLSYHNTGKSKYDRLNIAYEGNDYIAPSNERIEEIKLKFEQNNFCTQIGG